MNLIVFLFLLVCVVLSVHLPPLVTLPIITTDWPAVAAQAYYRFGFSL
jgi:hypothetical protein